MLRNRASRGVYPRVSPLDRRTSKRAAGGIRGGRAWHGACPVTLARARERRLRAHCRRRRVPPAQRTSRPTALTRSPMIEGARCPERLGKHFGDVSQFGVQLRTEEERLL